MERSIAATEADWKAAARYTHLERDDERHLASDGTVKSATVKTYRVQSIDGLRYRQLIAVDDQPLSAAEEKKEQEKSGKAAAEGRSKGEAEAQDLGVLLREMLQAFDFKLLGQETVARTPVYVIELTPRPGYEPPNEKAKVLTKMRGKLWITRRGYQWVRAEAEVFEPVSFYAFVGRLEPGSRLEFEQGPIDRQVWLPKTMKLRIGAKILLVKGRNTELVRTYHTYQREAPPRASAPRQLSKNRPF